MRNDMNTLVNGLKSAKLPVVPMSPKHGPTLFMSESVEVKQSTIAIFSRDITKAPIKAMMTNRNMWFETADTVSFGRSLRFSFTGLMTLGCSLV